MLGPKYIKNYVECVEVEAAWNFDKVASMN